MSTPASEGLSLFFLSLLFLHALDTTTGAVICFFIFYGVRKGMGGWTVFPPTYPLKDT